MPPLNNDFESNVPQLFILDSRTFVAKSGLSRLRAFWGALLAKIWWEGAQEHFKGPGSQAISIWRDIEGTCRVHASLLISSDIFKKIAMWIF